MAHEMDLTYSSYSGIPVATLMRILQPMFGVQYFCTAPGGTSSEEELPRKVRGSDP